MTYVPSAWKKVVERRCACGAEPVYGRAGLWYCLACWANSGMWKDSACITHTAGVGFYEKKQ